MAIAGAIRIQIALEENEKLKKLSKFKRKAIEITSWVMGISGMGSCAYTLNGLFEFYLYRKHAQEHRYITRQNGSDKATNGRLHRIGLKLKKEYEPFIKIEVKEYTQKTFLEKYGNFVEEIDDYDTFCQISQQIQRQSSLLLNKKSDA